MHERTRIANRPKAEQGLCQPVAKVTGPQRKCQGCWERRRLGRRLQRRLRAEMGTPSTAFAMHATWDPGSPSACGGCTADYSWWDGEGNSGFLHLRLGLKRLGISPGKAWGRRRKWAKKKVSDLTNRRAPSSCLSTCLIPAGQTSHVLGNACCTVVGEL